MVKDTIPTKELKLEGKDKEFLRQYSKENIERIISLDYLKFVRNARLWRDKNYQGGEHGLRNDEKVKEKEIRRAQEYLNFMIKKGIIGGSEIKVDGKYGPQTKSAIEAFQKKVNVFIKEGKMDISVPPTKGEERLAASIVRGLNRQGKNLYDDTGTRMIEGKYGKKYTFRLKMQPYMAEGGKHGGLIEIYHKGELMKKVLFTLDKKGKTEVTGVGLRSILEDGYLGVETRRAMALYAEQMLKKPITEKPAVAKIPTPVKSETIVKVGYSFKADAMHGWLAISNRMKELDGGKAKFEMAKETVNKINLTLWNLSYTSEIMLEESPIYVKIRGKEYRATWHGAIKALRDDGVSYVDFAKVWWEELKKNNATKEVANKVENGDLVVGNPQRFLVIEKVNKRAGHLSRDVGIDVTELEMRVASIRTNILKILPEGYWRDEVVKKIDDIEMKIKENAQSIKYENDEQFLRELNGMWELHSRLNFIYDNFGKRYDSSNVFEVGEVLLWGGTEPKIRKNLEDIFLSYSNLSEFRNFGSIRNEKLTEAERLFRKEFGSKSTKGMVDDFLNLCTVKGKGGYYIDFSKVPQEMKAFAAKLYYDINDKYVMEQVKNNLARAEGKEKQVSMR